MIYHIVTLIWYPALLLMFPEIAPAELKGHNTGSRPVCLMQTVEDLSMVYTHWIQWKHFINEWLHLHSHQVTHIHCHTCYWMTWHVHARILVVVQEPGNRVWKYVSLIMGWLYVVAQSHKPINLQVNLSAIGDPVTLALIYCTPKLHVSWHIEAGTKWPPFCR